MIMMYEHKRNEILCDFFSVPNKKVYCHRLRRKLIAELGGCCLVCKSKSKLQFSHIGDTRVGGTGRGRILRYIDVLLFKKKYKLMCARCHAIFDTLRRFNGNKQENAMKILRKLIMKDKRIDFGDIFTFNCEKNKFVLKDNYYLSVKKEIKVISLHE